VFLNGEFECCGVDCCGICLCCVVCVCVVCISGCNDVRFVLCDLVCGV